MDELQMFIDLIFICVDHSSSSQIVVSKYSSDIREDRFWKQQVEESDMTDRIVTIVT